MLVFPRNPHGQSKLRAEAAVERVPDLAFPCNQMDEYLNCHHRTFHPVTDGDRCGDPQQISVLSSQSPVKEREEG